MVHGRDHQRLTTSGTTKLGENGKMARNSKQSKEKKKTQAQINYENLQAGLSMIKQHPLFGNCFYCYERADGKNLGKQVYAAVSSSGLILLNENQYLQPKQWAYVIAHAKLHLAFGHFDSEKMPGLFMKSLIMEKENGKQTVTRFYGIWLAISM